MPPKQKQRSLIPRLRGNKKTKNSQDKLDTEEFIAQSQPQEIVGQDPDGTPPNLTVQYIIMPDNMQIPYSQASGSHTIEQMTIIDCGMVTVGNTSSSSNRNNTLSGHTFTEFRISDTRGLHIGNTGTGSEGHRITKFQIERSDVPYVGDFATVDEKNQTYHSVTEPKKQA